MAERGCHVGLRAQVKWLLLAGPFECLCEQGDAYKAIPWILGQRFQDHVFDGLRQGRIMLAQKWRWVRHLLRDDLPGGACKGAHPTEPLVDDDAERVLVAGKDGLATNLLRSHVGQRARHLLGGELFGRWGEE